MKKKILVVVAHPDDEILGIGGTILKHKQNGDDIYCIITAEGIGSRYDSEDTKEEVSILHTQSEQVAKKLGIKEIYLLGFPDNRMDTMDLLDIIKPIEKIISDINPDIIYTHHEHDLNIDHRLCFQAVMTICRPIGDSVKSIYTFETLSSTEWQTRKQQFEPNMYINIEEYIEEKINIMKLYKDELREYPHPRSEEGIRILAQYRGLESGSRYAEALCLIRGGK